MTEGSVSKRCTCTEGGRRLGTRCPKLRRPNGGWNPTHGTWGYQLELPALPGNKRRQLRRSGFDGAHEVHNCRSRPANRRSRLSSSSRGGGGD